jgi:hypothetical protein
VKVLTIATKSLLVINLMGRVFMQENLDCPFRALDAILEQYRDALMVEETHLDRLAKLAPNEPRYFDTGRRPGKLVPRWNLVVPEEVLSRSWGEVL